MIAQASPSPETARRRALQAAADDPLLTRHEVEAECGLSRPTIYRMMAAGTFPTGKRISPRARRWPRSAIEKWKAQQPTS